jgi:hypothetical protein
MVLQDSWSAICFYLYSSDRDARMARILVPDFCGLAISRLLHKKTNPMQGLSRPFLNQVECGKFLRSPSIVVASSLPASAISFLERAELYLYARAQRLFIPRTTLLHTPVALRLKSYDLGFPYEELVSIKSHPESTAPTLRYPVRGASVGLARYNEALWLFSDAMCLIKYALLVRRAPKRSTGWLSSLILFSRPSKSSDFSGHT